MKRLIKQAGNVINLVEQLGKELNQICDNLDLDVDVDSTINDVEEYLQEEKVASYKKNFVRKAGVVQDIEDKISEIESLMPEDTRANFLIRSLENLIDNIKQKIETKYSDYIETFDIDITNVKDIKILEFIDEVEELDNSLLSVIQDMEKSELEKRIAIYQKYKKEADSIDRFIYECIEIKNLDRLVKCNSCEEVGYLYDYEYWDCDKYKYFYYQDDWDLYISYYETMKELKDDLLDAWGEAFNDEDYNIFKESINSCNTINEINAIFKEELPLLYSHSHSNSYRGLDYCGKLNYNIYKEQRNQEYLSGIFVNVFKNPPDDLLQY